MQLALAALTWGATVVHHGQAVRGQRQRDRVRHGASSLGLTMVGPVAGLAVDAAKTMPLVWLKWLVGLLLVHDFVLAPAGPPDRPPVA